MIGNVAEGVRFLVGVSHLPIFVGEGHIRRVFLAMVALSILAGWIKQGGSNRRSPYHHHVGRGWRIFFSRIRTNFTGTPDRGWVRTRDPHPQYRPWFLEMAQTE